MPGHQELLPAHQGQIGRLGAGAKLAKLSAHCQHVREQFDRDGWALVPRFITPREVEALRRSSDELARKGAHLTADAEIEGARYQVQTASGRRGESAIAPGALRKITFASSGSVEVGLLRNDRRVLKLVESVGVTSPRWIVDQINLKNCCNVPPPLAQLAKEKGIELLTHGDCTDILPSGTLRELLGPGLQGAGVLSEDGSDKNGLQGDLVPQWVVKYTAFVKDRGVIENKGYFAGAELVA